METKKLRPQARMQTRRISILVFVAPGVLVALLVSVLFWQVARLINAGNWVDHTDLVVAQANALEKQVLDLETGLRGFVITRKSNFLEPYNAALPGIRDSIEDLKGLVSDSSAQVEKIKSVQADIEKWIPYSQTLIQMVRSGKNVAPLIETEQGKRMIDHIRSTMGSFIEFETSLRDVRIGAAKSSSRSITLMTGVLLLVTAIIALWLLRLVRRWENQLVESEERYRSLVDNIRDYAVYMIDPDGYIASWNSGAERLKGYRADEILGKHYSVCFTPEAITADEPAQALKEAAEKGIVHREGWRMKKDGTRFWAEVILRPIFKANGQLYGFSKITRDLTERRMYENELKNTLRMAQSAVRSREDTLAVVSHDLKNPILSILLNVELEQKVIQKQKLGPEEVIILQRLSDNIGKAAHRANQLIQDLLNWAKIESGNLSVEVKPTRISDVIDEVVTALRPIADEKGISLSFESIPQECVVQCDATRIVQVLMNLAGNAIKFSQRGGAVMIRLSQCNDEFAEILVHDNGPGIAPDALPHIFDRYWQPEQTKRQGTGLGLFIAKGIVDAHGGRIWVKSEPGQGSTFGFMLRRVKENQGLTRTNPPPFSQGVRNG